MNANQINRIGAKILNEQYSMYGYGGGANPASTHMTTKDIKKVVAKDSISHIWDNYKHEILFAASIAALLIPIPGVNVAISAGIAGADAALYWKEGNRYEAMTMAAFALMPGMGKLVSKIPFIAKIGSKGMKILFRKVIQAKRGVKVAFDWMERQILKLLPKNSKLIQSEMAKKIAKSKVVKSAKRKLSNTLTKTPIAAGKVAVYGGAIDAFTQFAIDPVYKAAGFDIKDVESGNAADLDALVQLNKQMK